MTQAANLAVSSGCLPRLPLTVPPPPPTIRCSSPSGDTNNSSNTCTYQIGLFLYLSSHLITVWKAQLPWRTALVTSAAVLGRSKQAWAASSSCVSHLPPSPEGQSPSNYLPAGALTNQWESLPGIEPTSQWWRASALPPAPPVCFKKREAFEKELEQKDCCLCEREKKNLSHLYYSDTSKQLDVSSDKERGEEKGMVVRGGTQDYFC